MSELSTRPEERPSKTQRKRQMHERQALGAKLVELNAEQLARLRLPERLHESIMQAREVRGHEARRRQLQFIGKLMRTADYESIRSAYEALLGPSRALVGLMHRCEQLREELIDDESALERFVGEHPGADVQWLRVKLRAVRQEGAAPASARHARELYRYLHTLLQTEAKAGGAT
jgi:ribosome-associated protein